MEAIPRRWKPYAILFILILNPKKRFHWIFAYVGHIGVYAGDVGAYAGDVGEYVGGPGDGDPGFCDGNAELGAGDIELGVGVSAKYAASSYAGEPPKLLFAGCPCFFLRFSYSEMFSISSSPLLVSA